MSLKNNEGYINIRTKDIEGLDDLEVKTIKLASDELIVVKNGEKDGICFSIEEVEALYNFAQILKTNKNKVEG